MPSPLEEYLAIYDAEAGAVFVQLDRAIRQAGPDLDVAIKYRLLSYTSRRTGRTGNGPLQGPAASLRVAGGRGSFDLSASSGRAPRR